MNGPISWLYNSPLNRFLKTSAEGADTLLWLARNRSKWQPGAYYANRKVAQYNSFAKNDLTNKKVWEITEKLLS